MKLKAKNIITIVVVIAVLVMEISEKCGFGSYINFYTAFTSQNEITPEKWRRQTRGLAE